MQPSDTIETVKLKIQSKESIPPAQQSLTLNGTGLQSARTLASYSIQKQTTLQLRLISSNTASPVLQVSLEVLF